MGKCQRVLHYVSFIVSRATGFYDQHPPSVTTVRFVRPAICAAPDNSQAEKWDSLTRNWYVAPPLSSPTSCEPWHRQSYREILSQIKLFLVDEVRVSSVRYIADEAKLLDRRSTS